MKTFTLACSSTVDMPCAYLQRREIPYLCFYYSIDGRDYPDDLGQTEPIASFYQKIVDGAMPTTTQINIERYIEFFTPMLEAGQDVLYLELSSGISGSYASACMACKELSERFPERTLYVVDSRAASSGAGLLLDAVADKRDEGVAIREAIDFVERIKLRVHHWVYTTDLTHLRRGGRISAASATLGTILNLCPIINVSDEGKLIARAKARGKKRAADELVARMRKHADGGSNYAGRCYISHAARGEEARALAEQVKRAFASIDGEIMICDIGTVIGAHTGPGTVALFFFGDERVN